jgi:hypothetical protein
MIDLASYEPYWEGVDFEAMLLMSVDLDDVIGKCKCHALCKCEETQ